MTLFSYWQNRLPSNRWLASICGMAMGTPLGVCVNCAAPIAKAVYESTRNIAASLSLMFSSPALNIVVLTMLFAFFPFYMAILKLGGTILLILCIVPLISPVIEEKQPVQALSFLKYDNVKDNESWLTALQGTAKDYLKGLWYIVIRTVPLMFLAGFLGALFSHLWQFDNLTNDFPSIWLLAGVSFISTLLPLPIAFDIMLSQSLMISGTHAAIISTLLFTLGIFSIYSFFIIWRAISFALAMRLYIIISLMGVVIGCVGGYYSDYKSAQWQETYDKLILEDEVKKKPISKTTFKLHKTNSLAKTEIAAHIYTLKQNSPSKSGEKPFTQYTASDFGIDHIDVPDTAKFTEPFFHGRGIASGDFDKDGWLDIVIATNNGFKLYQNINGKSFKQINYLPEELAGKEAFAIAMVDIDNDGWLDIYLTTFTQGHYIIFNPLGEKKAVIHIAKNKALVTMGLSFGDLNKDGLLDMSWGNWSGGDMTRRYPADEAKNQLFINQGKGKFLETELEDFPGQTLSMLLSDINSDGNLDLMTSNDFAVPDLFYLGKDKKLELQQWDKARKQFPSSPALSMGVDSGDINNDLKLDIYMAGASTVMPDDGKSVSEHCKTIDDSNMRSQCIFIAMQVGVEHFGGECSALEKIEKLQELSWYNDKKIFRDCFTNKMLYMAIRDKDPALCDKIPAKYKHYKTMCEDGVSYSTPPAIYHTKYSQIVPDSNILLKNSDDGFKDISEQANVNLGGWSWNAKFADLDNDGWQDIYVANGSPLTNYMGLSPHSTNIFYHNQKGKDFAAEQKSFGLEDFDHVSAYIYLDFDNDGDLDIISNTIYGPLKIYVNNQQKNHNISFRLEDSKGNKSCIGCKIIIHYGDGQNQIREIKSGGGYLSFDPAIAHFGLGQYEQVDQVEIIWSIGEKTSLKQPLKAGQYIISR